VLLTFLYAELSTLSEALTPSLHLQMCKQWWYRPCTALKRQHILWLLLPRKSRCQQFTPSCHSDLSSQWAI